MYMTILFFIITVIIYIVREKNIINPIVIFSSVWASSLFLASLKLFGMTEVTDKAMNLLVSGIISFVIGAVIMYIIKNNHRCKNKKEENFKKAFKKEEIDYRAINILLIIGILVVIPLVIKVTGMLINGVDYSNIRSMYYSYGDKESLIKNETLFTLFDWGTAIILASATPIIIAGIINRKINKFSIISLMIFTLLHCYVTAGRSQLFIIAIEIVLIYLLNKEKINKNIIKIIRKIVVAMFVVIFVMSIARDNSKEGSVNQWYAYFSLPAPYFSNLINYVDNQNVKTNGVATFYGPYLMVQKAVKGTTGYKLPNADYYFNVINKPQNHWVKIFKDSPDYYNAYGTMFYNFYLDFRVFGIIALSLLYGILMEKVYLDAKHEESIFKQVLYVMLVMGVFNSFIRWQFASPTIFISLVLIRFLIKKKKVNKLNEKPKKILVFGITENPGGVESVIMNYYRNIDREKMQFDFLCNTVNVAYEDEIRNLGGKIYRVTPRNKNRIKFYKDMKVFFSKKASEYSAIWVNVCSLANIDYLKYAKKYGIEKRIIHCHNSQNMDSFIRGILHKWNKMFLSNYATDFWSCAEDSSEWFYSKKVIKGPNYHIIKNAIDYDKYSFDDKISKDYKKELNIENKIVLGNVGRFHFQKNQMFLIDVFNELYKLDDKFTLLLVGDGEDKEQIVEKINSLNLNNSIKLLGVRNDVNNIFQAMDALLFPSLFEGLPLVLIEAQANGLQIFASDTITEDIKMSENFEFISLNKDAKSWANTIYENYKKNKFDRINNYENILKRGYEINNEVKKLESYLERN